MKTADIRVVLVPGVTRPDKTTRLMTATLPPTWPKYERVPLGPVVTLEQALTEPYAAAPFDPRGYNDGRCYLMQCAPMAERNGRAPRLATDAWRHEGGVKMQLLLTDIDAQHKGAPGFSIERWWGSQKPALAAFLSAHPGAFVACSKGGLRIYQALSSVFVIDSEERADDWKARYTAWCSQVRSIAWVGARVDETKDWARLQRIPHDTRDGVLQLLPTIGDTADVGTVELPPPAPRKPRTSLRAYTGDTVPVKVSRSTLQLVAAIIPRQGDGVHETALALGGILASSHWATDDCVEVVEAVFAMGGIVREDIGRSARSSIESARSGARSFGWPRFRALCSGSAIRSVRAACDALEASVPGLRKDPPPDGHHD